MLTLTLAAFSGGILWAILGIGFLIFIHEYGHYSACRLTGTRVETFSIGFGPRLFGWERSPGRGRLFTWGRRRLPAEQHAMDFRVALIPLGGYVKMAGENPGQPRSGASDEFASQSISERLLIVSAGVIMNALTAFVFYAATFLGGIEKEPPIVGTVEVGTPAWTAGLETGDRVISVDGNPVASFIDLRVEAAFLPKGEPRPMIVERDGARRTLEVRARYSEEHGVVQLGLRPALTLTLGAGAQALRLGPTQAARVNGVPVRGGTEAALLIARALEDGERAEVDLGEGRSVTLSVTPPAAGAPPGPRLWKVGVQPSDPPVVEAARGPASDLKPGDVLLAAISGEQRVPLETAETLGRLALLVERLDGLVVRRAGVEATVALTGVEGRGAVLGLTRAVALAPATLAARPVAAGRRVFVDDTLYRYPAVPAEGKLAPGERILAVAGQPVASWDELVSRLSALTSDAPVALKVEDAAGQAREVLLKPVALEPLGRLELQQSVVKESLPVAGFLDGVSQGAGRLWREVRNTFRTIGSFFSGNISFQKNIAGPVTLVQASRRASEESFLDLLWFLAYVSVMLAVLNILPIPVLDGGHVVFLLAEKIRGRPLSDAAIGRMQLIGMLLLLTLMVFAIKNDFILNF